MEPIYDCILPGGYNFYGSCELPLLIQTHLWCLGLSHAVRENHLRTSGIQNPLKPAVHLAIDWGFECFAPIFHGWSTPNKS